MENKKQISHEGELHLGGTIIPCYVLEDGTRVLSSSAMQKALKVQGDSSNPSGTRLARYLNQKTLKSFIYKDKDPGHFKPIICYKGEQKINGYEATVLADICDAFLEARKNIQLSARQAIIAEQCEILIRGFARVGIIALVDEATGYQYEREKDELQKVLKAFISEELLPWQKRFPDIYYKELFRLNGWNFTINGIQKRPGVIGKWTNTLIYEQLPNGVLEKLKKQTPKSSKGNYTARFHQNLTLDIGEPTLTAQINQIVTLFQLSDNMKHMWEQFDKLNKRKQEQLQQPFSFDDKGHTVELKEELLKDDFDKGIQRILSYTTDKDKE